MINIKFFCLIIIIIFFLQTTPTFSTNLVFQAEKPEKAQMILIIDFEDFMCFSCLESFLHFCYSLPLQFQQKSLFGVVIFEGKIGARSEDVAVKIVEKKIRGFRKANSIRFPILIDRHHVFDAIADKGTTIIFFNGETRMVKRYIFPLSIKQKEEIQAALKTQ